MPTLRPRPRLLLQGGATLLFIGSAILAAIPVLYGSPRMRISVALRDVDARERAQFEHDSELGEGNPVGPGVWTYVPRDVGVDRLRALMAHPIVVATRGIDRDTAKLNTDVSLTERRGGLLTVPPLVSRASKLFGSAFLLFGFLGCVGAALIQAGALSATLPSRAAVLASIARFIQRGIPMATPRAAGLFRIVFGSLVLWFVRSVPASRGGIEPAVLAVAHGPYGVAVRWMTQHPISLAFVDVVLLMSGVLFIAGVWTRLSFAAFAGAFLAWVSVYTADTSIHTISALSVAVVCLAAAPWGDGASVDAWLGRRRGTPTPAPSRRYGYAIWIPGFVFGVAFLAAAWAKIGGGPGWITNGTVRYHFLTDLDHAAVQWGPQLTRIPAVAVAMSAAAVIVETLVITAAFVPSVVYRLVMGACALSLLVGFELFQGVFWPTWWILLVSFLPWQVIGAANVGRAPTAADSSLTGTQAAVIGCVVAQQLVMSLLATDARPFFSMYDMYSATHRPADDLKTPKPIVYRVVADTRGGWMPLPGCSVDEQVVAPMRDTLGDLRVPRASLAPAVAECLADWPKVTRVRFDGDRQEFEWSTGSLVWHRRVDMIGPLRIE